MAPSSIQVYLASIGALHRQLGYREPTRHNPRLNLVLRGAKRAHALATKTTWQPLTAPILAKVLAQVTDSTSLSEHDKRMLSAAFSLAFCGFLRVSEFTVPSKRAFNRRTHPTRSSIELHKDHFVFFIKQSKTDQFHHGNYVYVWRSGSQLCPVRAMERYLKSYKNDWHGKDPLFAFSDHTPLTRHSCLKHMRHLLHRAGYPSQLFNTHSFRIGAATHAAHLGMPSHYIKLLSRWNSTAYQKYTRSSATTVRKAASLLASSFTKYT